MSRRARAHIFGIGAVGLAALLLWGLAGLPDFGDFEGRYGELLTRIAVPERTATEVVGVTTFDFRGLDTLGEEFILFAAAVGVLVLLRIQRGEEEVAAELRERQPTGQSPSLRSLATALVAPLLVLGIYIVAHGHLTPGGGFQGGVILATAFVLAYLAGRGLSREAHRPLVAAEFLEGLGAAGLALVGVAGQIIAGIYLENFLPFGGFGDLLSGGQIPLSNLVVALEIVGALLVVLAEFLDQRLLGSEPE
jgi:multicomponent Na+:H+ antiporter subunit B